MNFVGASCVLTHSLRTHRSNMSAISVEHSMIEDDSKNNSLNNIKRHLLFLVARCKPVPDRLGFNDAISKCLQELDAIEEVSWLLRALEFSNFCNAQFKVNESFVGPCNVKAEGCYSPERGELQIAASGMYSDEDQSRRAFLGTLAHELAHWVMTIVFDNGGRPYRHNTKDGELYRKILNNVATESHLLHGRFKCVFENYKKDYHESELIVVIPHLLSLLPKPNISHWRTDGAKQLYEFYKLSVLKEIKSFVTNGTSIIERKTICELNSKFGLFKSYIDIGIQFEIGYFDHNSNQSIDLLVTLIGSDSPHVSLFRVVSTKRYTQENVLCCTYSDIMTDGVEIKKCFEKLAECKALVLVCTRDDREEESYHMVLEIFAKSAKDFEKRLILIVSREGLEEIESLLRKKNETFAFLKMKCLPENLTVDTLTAASKTTVLNTEIVFQGRHVELGKIISENERELIDGRVIEKLLVHREEISIGHDRTTSFAYDPDLIHVNDVICEDRLISMIVDEGDNVTSIRTAILLEGESLSCKRHLPNRVYDELCHLTGSDDLSSVFLKNHKDLELGQYKHVVLLDSQSNINHPSLLRRLNPQYSAVYCIGAKPDKTLVCTAIYCPGISFSRELIKFVDYDSKNPAAISADQFIQTKLLPRNCRNDALVLCDKAGTGKSWFLNALFGKFSETHWVIKIPIKFAKSSVDSLPMSDLTDEDVIRFLKFHENINDDFSENFLRYRIRNSSEYRLLLLFDGLEEMPWSELSTPQQNTEKIMNLLKYLTEDTFVQTILALRPEAKYILSKLPCQIYRFKTLNKTCDEYLSKLCRARINLFNSSISQGIGHLISNYTNVTKDFLDNPLHIEMLSEVIVEQIRGLKVPLNANSAEPNKFSSLVELYRAFVNIKYDLYFKENNISTIFIQDKMKQNFDFDFQRLAMFYLFGNKDICKSFLSNSELFVNSHGRLSLNWEKVSAMFSMGIITQHPSQERDIQFVHRTFSEYFASALIESWMQESSGRNNYKKLVVEGVICNPAVTFEMLDVMLKHQTISSEQISEYAVVMEGVDKLDIVKAFDRFAQLKFENTLLFLAECVNKSNELRKITKSRHYLELIKKRSPFVYPYPLLSVSEFCSCEIIQKLIEIGFDINHRGPGGKVMLHSLMKRGIWDLVKYIVENMESKVDVEDNDGMNLVHCAASSGNFELIEWLETRGMEPFKLCNKRKSAIDYAIEHGHLDVALRIIKKGLNNPVIERNRKLFLHAVCDSGNEEFLKNLLLDGWKNELNNVDDEGFTPLHLSVDCGHLNIAKILVNNGSDVKAKSGDGRTIIHFAARNGDPNLVEWCMSFCRDPQFHSINDCDNDDKRTPLHIAAERGHFSAVKILVSFGADLSIESNDKFSSLHFATFSGNYDLVEWYLRRVEHEQWFDINSETDDRVTALHIAVEQGHLEVAKLLVASGGDKTKLSNNELSILHYAVMSESLDVVEWSLAISDKDLVHYRDSKGRTTVHLAAERGLLSIMETLTNKGGDLTVKSYDESTVLHYVAKNGNSVLMRWCLSRLGRLYDVNCYNIEGKTPFDIAHENNDHRTMNVLEAHGGLKKRSYQTRVTTVVNNETRNRRILLSAAGHSRDKQVRLIDKNHDQSINGERDSIVLMEGKSSSSRETENAGEGRELVNRELLPRLAEGNHKGILQQSPSKEIQPKVFRKTPLYIAVSRNDVGGVQTIVNSIGELTKDDHFCHDERQRTPLHLAVEKSYFSIVQMITAYGAEKKNDLHVYFNSVDDKGRTPLHRAVELKHFGITQLLVCYGSSLKSAELFDINSRDEQGKTPLQLAMELGCNDIKTLLIGYGAK